MKSFKELIKEDMIQDFEIRFDKESDWKKAGKIVIDYLKKDAPKHAKALLTKTYVIGPDPMMVAVGDTNQKLKPPVNLNKLYDTLRKLPSSRDKYWIKIPKKQEKDALGEEKYPQSLLLKNKGEFDPRKMSSMQKKKFDALYKKMDGGKEHQAIKKKIKNKVKADDAFSYMIQKKVMRIKEGKMIWNHRPTISDGTMQMGIFDDDRGKAEEAARQLIFFLRKNKKTKIGKSDPEQNDSNADIAKYSEELSKLIFDDKLLDDLEPNGNNENQNANDLVIGRLRDLGVRIK